MEGQAKDDFLLFGRVESSEDAHSGGKKLTNEKDSSWTIETVNK